MRVDWLIRIYKGPWGYRLIRWAMALVFLGAGLSKLINLDIFLLILEIYISDSPLYLPASWLRPAALLLAWLEIITGLGLMADWRGFLTLMTGQMLFFIGLLIYGIATGLDTPCGCFVLDDPDEPFHHGLAPALYRDGLMMLAIAYLYWWKRSCQPADQSGQSD